MKTIDVVIYREGKYWVSQALNVDVSSFGDSPEEALTSTQEALELYFEDDPEIEIREVNDARIEEIRVQAL
jgi:predicted RNase H-like HicB family nuclease